MSKDTALRLALEALKNSWTEPNNEQYEIEKEAIVAIKAALEAKDEPVAIYGYCPVCGAKGTSRERHPDGNTTCVNGHKYKSRDTLSAPPQQEAKDDPVEQPKVRTGDCLLVGVCASEGHKIQSRRTWVGLTNQELSDCWDTIPERAMKQVEAKLKEKNT